MPLAVVLIKLPPSRAHLLLEVRYFVKKRLPFLRERVKFCFCFCLIAFVSEEFALRAGDLFPEVVPSLFIGVDNRLLFGDVLRRAAACLLKRFQLRCQSVQLLPLSRQRDFHFLTAVCDFVVLAAFTLNLLRHPLDAPFGGGALLL